MNSRGKRLGAALLFLSVFLFLLSGCGRTPETRTVLLPEKSQALSSDTAEHTSGYTVQNMYSREFSTFLGMEGSCFLQDTQDHRVRLMTAGEEWEAKSTLMDYRYGFFETEYAVPGDQMIYIWEWWNTESENRARGVPEFLSPDGKYLLVPMRSYSYQGSQLYLTDLETGEQKLLLDGDELGYSGEHYFIFASWSRDSSLLCYGFYPKSTTVWNSDLLEKDMYTLHYWDVKENKTAGSITYDPAALGMENRENDLDLTGTRIYLDRAGEQVLTVFVSEMLTTENSTVYKDGTEIVAMLQSFSSETGIAWPGEKSSRFTVAFYFSLWPEAATGRCYILSPEEGMYVFDGTDGTFQRLEPVGGMETGTEVTKFCVLDEGQTFITAERTMDKNQDICIYQKQGGTLTRQILYKHAGQVLKLEYDPEGRRLLAETGEEAEGIGFMWSAKRRALILEF